MLTSAPPVVRGCIAVLLLMINTLVLATPLFIIALAKALVPVKSFCIQCSSLLNQIVSLWCLFNEGTMNLLSPTRITLSGEDALEKINTQTSYLVISNHLCCADIVLAQVLLNKRAPQLKFFLKKELIWVPVLGLCWWALDFPFMNRHSKQYLARHPDKKGTDLENTRIACAKLQDTPVSIFNFLEGTRFTPAKQSKQASPYKHLLKPKSGGIGFVMGAMENQIKSIIDITLQYQGKPPSFWGFLCGRCPAVHMHVELIQIPEQFLGKNYMEDREFRAEIQRWVNLRWEEKDQRLEDKRW